MGSNGLLSDAELAPIAGGQMCRAAAAAWNAMNVEARNRGIELRPTGSKSSYRTLSQQQELWNLYTSGKGNLAAKPGTSNHGFGMAVDLATPEMRKMVDAIVSKRCSDAPSEWWHITYAPVCNGATWQGADPGPTGQAIPKTPEGTMAIAVGTMKDGRLEVFVEKADGSVWHAYNAKDGGWAHDSNGKLWFSMGTPGKS
jgi:hypothetical protein